MDVPAFATAEAPARAAVFAGGRLCALCGAARAHAITNDSAPKRSERAGSVFTMCLLSAHGLPAPERRCSNFERLRTLKDVSNRMRNVLLIHMKRTSFQAGATPQKRP